MYSRHAIGSPLHVGLVPSNYPRLCPAYAISRGYAISHSQCWAPLLKKDCNGCCNLSGAVCKCISERISPTRSLAADGSSVRIFPSSAADGVRGVSPWHTTLLARYSLLYPPATEARKRGVRRDKAPSTNGWEKAPGLAGIQSQGRALTRWYTTYLGRYCQSSHSLLWASHHTGNAGSFGERVGKVLN